MRHFGMIAVAVVFLLQAFAANGMPRVSANDDVLVICTASGMKTISLSDVGITLDQSQEDLAAVVSDGMCALCSLAHSVALAPAMSAAFSPAIDLDAHAPQAPPPDIHLANGFRDGQQARAPPSSV